MSEARVQDAAHGPETAAANTEHVDTPAPSLTSSAGSPPPAHASPASTDSPIPLVSPRGEGCGTFGQDSAVGAVAAAELPAPARREVGAPVAQDNEVATEPSANGLGHSTGGEDMLQSERGGEAPQSDYPNVCSADTAGAGNGAVTNGSADGNPALTNDSASTLEADGQPTAATASEQVDCGTAPGTPHQPGNTLGAASQGEPVGDEGQPGSDQGDSSHHAASGTPGHMDLELDVFGSMVRPMLRMPACWCVWRGVAAALFHRVLSFLFFFVCFFFLFFLGRWRVHRLGVSASRVCS